jgi:hypothetical protein
MNGNDEPEPLSPGVALSRSIGSEGIELIVSSADTVIDKLFSSGALDGVPILGLLSSGLKAVKEVRDQLYLKNVFRFLQELQITTEAMRGDFVRQLEKDGQLERFGEAILLILDHSDDALKPMIVGRILAAHIAGDIALYGKAMRLVAIVNRVYAADIVYLKSFRPGVQHDVDVAEALFAAGLLRNTGFDGGGVNQELEPGGYTYELNEYGQLLVTHGLSEPE